ncbi:hypothetical protein BV511_15685 [Methylorubrum extorquens]|uniref:hypothetical protein n=1 Tax=Methylorubrum extorquens TaxID=408 RepID=UPI0009726FC1|nr:hypothetical protein [Methylorubrum extorquens]APX86014.1 hypothetical protein BV511_15685 [Methylorubrum extorquens]
MLNDRASSRHYPEVDAARHALSRAILAARCRAGVSGTELIRRHDAAAGKAAAQVVRAGIAAQLAPALERAPPEAIARAVERTPSLARYPVGMASPKVRTAMRTGDLASWDLDRQCAVAASLGHRVEVVLVPPGMRAVVAFEPA